MTQATAAREGADDVLRVLGASARPRVITSPSLASLVARRIEDRVVEAGWPVGTMLGSEAELREQYGVSRAVLREAIRIVEHTGAATMRLGPNGGLVVAQPNRSAVVTAMGVWFSYVGVTIGEMFDVRHVLLTGAMRLAALRRSDADLDRVGMRIDSIERSGPVSPRALSALESDIVDLARNPALALFVAAVGDLGVTRLSNGRAALDPPLSGEETLAHLGNYRGLIDAIADGDADSAVRRMDRLIDAVRSRLSDAACSHHLDGYHPPDRKLAERVAHDVRDAIERAGWPVGAVLGSETDVADHYGVSRGVLREAVRILEHHGALRMKRGPHGGLVVSAPDNSAIVRSARILLDHAGVTGEQLYEARSVLEVAITRLAAARRTSHSLADLASAIEMEERVGDSVLHFLPVHRALAEATGNRLFVLFVDVVGELVLPRLAPEQRMPDAIQRLSVEVHAAHAGVIDAVVAGDPDLAAQRMARHLRASVTVVGTTFRKKQFND